MGRRALSGVGKFERNELGGLGIACFVNGREETGAVVSCAVGA